MIPPIDRTVIDFITTHANTAIDDLLLRTTALPGVPMSFIAAQVQARREQAKKLPTWVAEPWVMFPARIALEQASSERTANYKAALIAHWLAARGVTAPRFVDLGAGLGVDSVAFAGAMPQAQGVLYEQDA